MFLNRVRNYADSRKDVPPTNPGVRLVEQYKLAYNDDGTKDLVVDGYLDIYEEIQSHADSVDIHKIIERCTMIGDMSELYKTEGFYGDLAMFPKTRAEALQMLSEAQNIWDKLPVDIKKKFDNNVDNFFSTAFTEEWTKKLEIVPDEKVEDVKEVIENE